TATSAPKPEPADGGGNYYVLNGCLHYEPDIQNLFERFRPLVSDASRVVIVYYSQLWKPLVTLATMLGLRSKHPEENWISHEDVANLLYLANFEVVRRESKILCPVYIP